MTLGERLGGLVRDALQGLYNAATGKRHASGDRLEQHAAEGEQVGAVIDLLPAHLLRRPAPYNRPCP